MNGRWRVQPRGAKRVGRRGSSCAASDTRRCSGTARCSSSSAPAVRRRLGPDVLADEFDAARALAGARGARRPPAGRGASGPTRRRRDRQHVDGGGALGGPRLAVGARAATSTTRRSRRRSPRSPADAGVARGRTPGPERLPPRGPSCRRCGTIIRSRGQGDAKRMAYWCPSAREEAGRPPRKRSRGSVAPRTCRRPPWLLPRRLRLPRPRARGGRRASVRVRGARAARRPGALRVPPARADLHRGARGALCGARGRAPRARRPRARACRRDLRARPRRPRAHRKSRRCSAPCCCRCWSRPPRPAAASTGTTSPSSVPTPSSSSRSSATRAPTRRSRRSWGSRWRRRSSSATASASAQPRRASSRAHWPEAQGLLPQEFGREPDRYCVLELERAPRGRRGAARRAGGARRRGHRPSAGDGGAVAAGPVLFERLDWRPFGIRPVLPIAATQPPGEPTVSMRFRGQLARELLRAPRACRRRPGPRRGARPLGALALPGRALPLRAAPGLARRRFSARRGRCGPPCCSARSGSPATRPRGAARPRRTARRRPARADAVRRALVEVLAARRADGLIGARRSAARACGRARPQA